MKKFWQSTNFWIAATMLIGGFFVGFPQEEGERGVQTVFTLLAIGATLRNFFKNAEFNWREWVANSNFMNYLAIIVTMIFPVVPIEAFDALHIILKNAIGGDFQGIFTGVFSLLTILWNLIFNRNPQPEPEGI